MAVKPSTTLEKNAIVVVQSSQEVLVDLVNPGKPDTGTVNQGYDENLDRPRPCYLDQYMEYVHSSKTGLCLTYLRNYNIIFIIDDSGSVTPQIFVV